METNTHSRLNDWFHAQNKEVQEWTLGLFRWAERREKEKWFEAQSPEMQEWLRSNPNATDAKLEWFSQQSPDLQEWMKCMPNSAKVATVEDATPRESPYGVITIPIEESFPRLVENTRFFCSLKTE